MKTLHVESSDLATSRGQILALLIILPGGAWQQMKLILYLIPTYSKEKLALAARDVAPFRHAEQLCVCRRGRFQCGHQRMRNRSVFFFIAINTVICFLL